MSLKPLIISDDDESSPEKTPSMKDSISVGSLFTLDYIYNLPNKDKLKDENQARLTKEATVVAEELTKKKFPKNIFTAAEIKSYKKEKFLGKIHKIKGDAYINNLIFDFAKYEVIFPPLDKEIPDRILNSPACKVLSKHFIEIKKNWLDAGVSQVTLSIRETPAGMIEIKIQDNGRGFSDRFIPSHPNSNQSISYGSFVSDPIKDKISGERRINMIVSDKVKHKDFGGAGRGLAGMFRELAKEKGGNLYIGNVIVNRDEQNILNADVVGISKELPFDSEISGAEITLVSPVYSCPADILDLSKTNWKIPNIQEENMFVFWMKKKLALITDFFASVVKNLVKKMTSQPVEPVVSIPSVSSTQKIFKTASLSATSILEKSLESSNTFPPVAAKAVEENFVSGAELSTESNSPSLPHLKTPRNNRAD